MNCCHVQPDKKPQRSLLRKASGCVGSGTLLVLLPKCPLCIAAYLAVWTGAGAAITIATRLRPLLEILFAASVALLLFRFLAARISLKAGEQSRLTK
jgi:hypothetical protein